VETHMNFSQVKGSYDSLGLLKILREFVFRSDDRQYKYKVEDQAKWAYYNLRQTPEMSCQEYFERVRNVVDVIKSLGGTLVDDMHLQEELGPLTQGGYTYVQYQQARERILDKKIAYILLVRADRNRFGKLIEEVKNSYLKGNNDYPTTPTEAYNLLVYFKNYNSNKRGVPDGGLDQVAFMSEGKKLRTDGKFPHIKCFRWGKFGHYKSDCSEKEKEKSTKSEESTQYCQVVTATALMTKVMWMGRKEEINPMWILYDNESTIDIIKIRRW
jgi:hypothetical protein